MTKPGFAFARLLVPVLAALLPLACSSKDDRSLVVLDLQVAAEAAIPATLHISASQSAEVRSLDVAWTKPSSRTLQIGVYIPSGISGRVSITVKGYDDQHNLIAEGKLDKADLTVGGSVGPLTVVLSPSRAPVADGGIDALPVEAGQPVVPDSGVPADGASVVDSGVSDAKTVDTTIGDLVVPTDAKDAPVADGVPPELSDSGVAQPEVTVAVDVSPESIGATADGGDGSPSIDAGHTPAWEPAQNIQNDPSQPTYDFALAVDPIKEHVYVAWNESTTVNVKRWNRATATWEKPVTVENRGDPVTPAMGVDASGNVLLVWGQNTGVASQDGVWVVRSTDGMTWSPPVRISADKAFDVRLAVARNGTAHAVYNKQSNGWPLYTAYYDGTGWTENPTTIYENEYSNSTDARIVLRDTGDGLLLFSKGWGIAASVLTGQSFSAPLLLDPNVDTASAYDESIAMNRKGQGMVLWTESTSSNTVLLGRTYDPSVGWSNVLPTIVTSYSVAATAVALDEQNKATILWQQNKPSGDNMMGWHGTPTGPWNGATALETDNIAGALGNVTEYGTPSVAIDGNGDVLAVWRKEVSTVTTTFGAYATRYANGAWLPQAKLGQKDGLDISQLTLSVADSGFGAAAFLYTSAKTTSDPDAYNVMVSFFR
jgi:hypothetical protein